VRRYIQAIAWSGTRGRKALENSEQDGSTPKVGIDALLKDFSRYSREMRFAVRRGTAATQVAIILTVIAAAALTVDSVLSDPPRMTARLDPKASAAASALCGDEIGAEITARIRPADLTRDVVPLQLADGVCGKPATLHVRREWLLAVRDPE
jgi:hypothetical protein